VRYMLSAALAVGLVAMPVAASAEDKVYEPAPGNAVVVYTHHFKAADFDEGVKIVTRGFTEAQSAFGQTRKNYFLVNPETHDMIVVSFFDADESVDAWHGSSDRHDVLKKLEAVRRAPLEIERFTVEAITTTE